MNKQKQERALRKAESISRKMEKYKPIYDAYMSGATLRKIGAEYGITHETVRQIVNAEKRRIRRDMNNVEYTSDRVNVVRCRDCKHRPIDHREKHCVITCFRLEFPDNRCPCQCEDRLYNWYPSDDWYCANGERRESNA